MTQYPRSTLALDGDSNSRVERDRQDNTEQADPTHHSMSLPPIVCARTHPAQSIFASTRQPHPIPFTRFLRCETTFPLFLSFPINITRFQLKRPGRLLFNSHVCYTANPF
ncbi:hypothetical protein I7I50_10454 [Histoplasma capsulatum G186AR]|nr:hypothetical protein I7I50_10454 [Histoplasma capsulatum G186AR]